MAVNPCKECGSPVSDKADKCQICGAPAEKKTSRVTWLALIMFIGFGIMVFFKPESSGTRELSPEMQSLQARASIQSAISEGLKDPDSAKFTFKNDQCGYVNSKNSFGGYVGNKRFVSVDDIVDLEGHSVSQKEMDSLWNKHCS